MGNFPSNSLFPSHFLPKMRRLWNHHKWWAMRENSWTPPKSLSFSPLNQTLSHTIFSLFFILLIFNPTKHTLNQGRQFCIILASIADIYLYFMILHTISPLYASCICWENTWKIQFCISYINTQRNITDLLHSCEIACNIWVLETN